MQDIIIEIVKALINKYGNSSIELSPVDIDAVSDKYIDSNFKGDTLILEIKDKD